MLETTVGWVNKLFSLMETVSVWIMDFVGRHSGQLLLIALIIAVAKVFKLQIKV